MIHDIDDIHRKQLLSESLITRGKHILQSETISWEGRNNEKHDKKEEYGQVLTSSICMEICLEVYGV